jgi:hypothetical protein
MTMLVRIRPRVVVQPLKDRFIEAEIGEHGITDAGFLPSFLLREEDDRVMKLPKRWPDSLRPNFL